MITRGRVFDAELTPVWYRFMIQALSRGFKDVDASRSHSPTSRDISKVQNDTKVQYTIYNTLFVLVLPVVLCFRFLGVCGRLCKRPDVESRIPNAAAPFHSLRL
jgi:hypothetical protein